MNASGFSLVLVRIASAGTILVHGITRIAVGGVGPFGQFLENKDFPVGVALAWAITIFEILASLAIIANQAVRWLAIVVCIELIAGIYLIHFSAGWFVVGHGRNGMEFSVLLIICLLASCIIPGSKGAK